MAGKIHQRKLWALIRHQHWVITRAQLLAFGGTDHAIAHRIASGRLHRVYPGVYAVGRPELSRFGRWMAATLACGPTAVISHGSAAELYGIGRETGCIEVTVAAASAPRHRGVKVHRRGEVAATRRHGIPVTTPIETTVDLAAAHPRDEIEQALNEADLRGLLDLRELRTALYAMPPRRPGVAKLKRVIDRRTFTFTRSVLERRFLPIARRAGLPQPLTRVYVNGYEVDFFWPQLGLVVETDGGAFHRTPAQQATDRRRDQAHTAAGLTPLRFTHGQIRYEPGYVEGVLRRVASRLAPA